MAEPIRRNNDSDMVECWALWKAVRLARDIGIQHVHFEGDSLNVIKAINSKDVDRSHIGGIIEATKAELALFTKSMCSHIRMQGNSIAHELVRFATSSSASRTWLGDTHPSIRILATAEALNGFLLGGVEDLVWRWCFGGWAANSLGAMVWIKERSWFSGASLGQ
ncbi:hypothetical protein U1Q18_006114 [Sarracenia purpurea var. burkii]